VSGRAVEAKELAKIYRRFLHQNQFKTLKSALLTGSLLSDQKPEQEARSQAAVPQRLEPERQPGVARARELSSKERSLAT
jgi:hypothetical protein